MLINFAETCWTMTTVKTDLFSPLDLKTSRQKGQEKKEHVFSPLWIAFFLFFVLLSCLHAAPVRRVGQPQFFRSISIIFSDTWPTCILTIDILPTYTTRAPLTYIQSVTWPYDQVKTITYARVRCFWM